MKLFKKTKMFSTHFYILKIILMSSIFFRLQCLVFYFKLFMYNYFSFHTTVKKIIEDNEQLFSKNVIFFKKNNFYLFIFKYVLFYFFFFILF